jgi:predicted DCC family thiol-disulfide oxidoreductase YuxK
VAFFPLVLSIASGLAKDRARRFVFAPLQGDTFVAMVSEAERAKLPDSMIIRAADGRLLVRSAAALYVLDTIGGGWGVLSRLLRIVPRPVLDAAYRVVAAIRHRIGPPPPSTCPLVPADLRERFAA